MNENAIRILLFHLRWLVFLECLVPWHDLSFAGATFLAQTLCHLHRLDVVDLSALQLLLISYIICSLLIFIGLFLSIQTKKSSCN